MELYKKDPESALKTFEEMYSSNDPDVLYELALIYSELKFDSAKILDVLLKSGELGNDQAYLYIGKIYYYDLNEHSKAIEYLEKSAEMKNDTALYLLGTFSDNPEKQLDYYRRSSQLGNGYASEALGDIYRLLDIRKAKYYYENAIINKNMACMEKYKSLITDEDIRRLIMVKKCYITVRKEIDYYKDHESYKPNGYLYELIKKEYESFAKK